MVRSITLPQTGTIISLFLVSFIHFSDTLGQANDSLDVPPHQETLSDFITDSGSLFETPNDELQHILEESILDSLQNNAEAVKDHYDFRLTLSQSVHRKLDLTRGFSRAYKEGGYAGSPSAYFTRVNFQSSAGHSFRFVLEKDPGEAVKWDSETRRYGFDHVTGAVALKKLIIFDDVVLGDYSLSWGQGLLFANALTRSKTPLSAKRYLQARPRYRPSASRSESSSFRGSIASVQLFDVIKWSVFFSNRYIDASMYSDSTNSIRSLQRTGLHRSKNELFNKGALHEKIRGSNVSLHLNALHLALTGYTASFNHPFHGNLGRTEQFRLAGSRLSGASLYASYKTGRLLFSGEAAISNPGTSAFVAGIHLQTTRKDDLIVLWRNYAATYQSLYASGFGERTTAPKNETGLYAGYVMNLSRHIKWSAFIDQYYFPWVSTSIFKPYSGIEFYSLLEYSPRKWLSTIILYRSESKSTSSTVDTSALQQVKSASSLNKQYLRIQLYFIHSDYFQVRTRVESKWSKVKASNLHGFMMAQDLILRPNHRAKIHVRFSIFETDGNETNLYAVEKDVRFRYSIKTFSGTGRRNFLFLSYEFGKGWTIEFKYSETRFNRNITRGSGNEAFSGNRLREFHFQLIRFVQGKNR